MREPGNQERKAFGLGLGSEQHGCRKGDRTGPDQTAPERTAGWGLTAGRARISAV